MHMSCALIADGQFPCFKVHVCWSMRILISFHVVLKLLLFMLKAVYLAGTACSSQGTKLRQLYWLNNSIVKLVETTLLVHITPVHYAHGIRALYQTCMWCRQHAAQTVKNCVCHRVHSTHVVTHVPAAHQCTGNLEVAASPLYRW